MTQENTSLIIHGQYIKDLSFENPGAPESFNNAEQPGISLSLDISTNQLEEQVFEVTVNAGIKSQLGDKVLYLVELDYAGVFTVNADSPQDLEKMLLIKCPEILYPFIRRVVFNITADGGFIPLTLQPIDFMTLYQQNKALASNSNI